MSQRHIVECDRCHSEIKNGIDSRKVKGRDGGEMDLCPSCTSKLDRFLDGASIEVPP